MKKHILKLTENAFYPADGFLLGNGDISASFFSRRNALVIKLGKNDLWDNRLDLKDIPRPADIDELRYLISKNNFYCEGPSGKLKTDVLDNPRLIELCTHKGLSGSSPMPKPAAELILHTNGDLRKMQVEQSLCVEDGSLEVTISWDHDISLKLNAAIDPDKNVMAITWKSANYTGKNRFGGAFYGITKPYMFYFELKCYPEKTAFDHWRDNIPHLMTNGLPNTFPTTESLLVPAEYAVDGNIGSVTRQFPDTRLEIAAAGENMEVNCDCRGVLLYPQDNCESGTVIAGWETGKTPQISGIVPEKIFAASQAAAEKFFNTSRVSFSDKLLDDIYHSVMHVKRSVLKAGKIPPGLILASTLNDYTPWHGDYHLNYNYQSNFLGDFSAGHFDSGDAFFTGLEPLLKLGRKIAHDYYHCRGCFVQLSGFPFDVEDDYMGHLPFGRMAYMTGWVAAWFYRRWELSGDREWLKATGYPGLRDFALFYTDFLTLEDDGYFHAFPSNQAEENYTLEGTRDQVQVLRHARSSLEFALKCAKELDCDHELQKVWQNILDKLVPKGELPPHVPAEFAGFDGLAPVPAKEVLRYDSKFYTWYPGQMPYYLMTALRNGLFDLNGEDYSLLIEYLERWTLPNHLFRGMAATHYGYDGYWSEGLGIAGALLDMLAVNQCGTIRVFPGMPKDAEFSGIRVEGGFICSARKCGGKVQNISIEAVFDGELTLALPENGNYTDDSGKSFAGGMVYSRQMRAGEKAVLTLQKN